MKTKRNVMKTATFALVIGLTTLWIANYAPAATVIERSLNFASIGMIKGQTARINVTNMGAEAVVLNFAVLDDSGINFLERSEASVEPGKTVHVQLSADSLSFTQPRFELRGDVKYQYKSRTEDKLIASLEVFDSATGKTTAVLQPAFVPAVQ